MKHSTHCKFCKMPITVEIDDDYAALGDPYKLVEKASCNACADVRVLRRVLEDRISRLATVYVSMLKPSEAFKASTRKSMTKLLESYARMIARHHRCDGMAFDEECVNVVMEHPSKWAEVLTGLWRMYRDWERSREAETKMLL